MTTVLKPLYRTATRVIAASGRFIPYAAQKPVLAVALNEAFRAPLKRGDFDFLDGRRVRIRVNDLGIDWLIGIAADRLRPCDRELGADVCITGASRDFILLATRQADPDTLFFQRRIHVEGDTELGLGVKNTMDGMDWADLPLPLRKLVQTTSGIIERMRRPPSAARP